MRCNAAPLLERLVFLGLKGCAECVAGCGRVVGTYGNLICRAMGITIVIIAVLYVTLNTLDVLVTTVFVLLHFHFSFPLAVFCKRLCAFAAFSLSKQLQIYTL